MKNQGILNWRAWPPRAKKLGVVGSVIGFLLIVCGFALNRWAASFPSQGGDNAITMLIGVPSIFPLLPLGWVFDLFGARFPRDWDQGDLVWIPYFFSMPLNAILLGGLGVMIGYIGRWFGKRQVEEESTL